MTFEQWLEEKVDHAKRSSDETRRAAPSSWGAGYDCGYYDALQLLFSGLPKEIAHAQWPQDTTGHE